MISRKVTFMGTMLTVEVNIRTCQWVLLTRTASKTHEPTKPRGYASLRFPLYYHSDFRKHWQLLRSNPSPSTPEVLLVCSLLWRPTKLCVIEKVIISETWVRYGSYFVSWKFPTSFSCLLSILWLTGGGEPGSRALRVRAERFHSSRMDWELWCQTEVAGPPFVSICWRMAQDGWLR